MFARPSIAQNLFKFAASGCNFIFRIQYEGELIMLVLSSIPGVENIFLRAMRIGFSATSSA